MSSLRKTKELVVATPGNAARFAAVHSCSADAPVRVPVPHRSCGNRRLVRRGGAQRSQQFERARLSQTAEKRSIRIRASLQRCHDRRKINGAFRRCALQYEFFSNRFQPRLKTAIFDPCPAGTTPLTQDPANSPKSPIWTPARIGCTIAGTRAALAPGAQESPLRRWWP
jgi:hypothetical protein